MRLVLAALLLTGIAVRFATFAGDPGPTAVAAVPSPPIVLPPVEPVEPVEPPAAAVEVVEPPPVEVTQVAGHPQPDLVARGDLFMAAHDLASARLCYRRAAEAGDMQAEAKLRELAAR